MPLSRRAFLLGAIAAPVAVALPLAAAPVQVARHTVVFEHMGVTPESAQWFIANNVGWAAAVVQIIHADGSPIRYTDWDQSQG